MKALTIWQPWASLIIAGAKPYEFRGWRAPASLIGRRIVIHAAAKPVDRDEVSMLHFALSYLHADRAIARAAAESCLHRDEALPVLDDALRGALPMASGIGTAILGEPRNGFDIAAEFGVDRANDSIRDEHASWGWPLTDIEAWPEPIPMRGRQGLWNWPEPQDAGLIGRAA